MSVEKDLERLSGLMLDEFKRVNERFDTIDERFDTVDKRLEGIEERLTNIQAELKDIHARLEQLEQEARNFSGYAKEIDHLLTRVTAIEKHLGLHQHTKA
jgi:tetrahydromethanopterin S-methyltransferase subunit G